MFSVPEGLAANQPLADTTFKPPDFGVVTWGGGEVWPMIGSPANCDSLTESGESFCKRAFCSAVAGRINAGVERCAEFRAQFGKVFRPVPFLCAR
jgi:hypothetical protein